MIAMVLPPIHEKLNWVLSTGSVGVFTPLGSVPGEPSWKLPRLPINDAVASLSLVRLTSTKRMSVCTWDGNSGSSDGSTLVLVRAAVALPWTNTMLWRGSLAQAVQTIRLVAPGAMPVSKKDELPLACTSAILGSPMARRVIATGDCTSCCSPSPISMTGGKRPSAVQLPVTAKAVFIDSPISIKAPKTGLNFGQERLCMHLDPYSVIGFVG